LDLVTKERVRGVNSFNVGRFGFFIGSWRNFTEELEKYVCSTLSLLKSYRVQSVPRSIILDAYESAKPLSIITLQSSQ
jgi:hypothetical protein